MDLLKGPKINALNPIPVIGIESHSESFSKFNQNAFSRVSECAYYKAQARGFEPGHEVEDWLAAEVEAIQ